MKPRISMVTLGVANLKAATDFYQQGLGLPRLEPYNENISFFQLNGSWLGLYPWEELARDATVEPAGSGFRGVALAHNVNSRQAVDRLIEQAVSAGATVVKPAVDTFWGGYSGYFADLDGHLWEIAWNPHTWIGPKD